MYSRNFRVLPTIYRVIGSPTSRFSIGLGAGEESSAVPLFDNGSRGRKIRDLLSPISRSSLATAFTVGYRARPDKMERFAIVKRSDLQRGGHQKDPRKVTEPIDAAVTSASIIDIFFKILTEYGLGFLSVVVNMAIKHKSHDILPGYTDLGIFLRLERGYLCIVERRGKMNRVLYAGNSLSKSIPLYHYLIPFYERVAYTQWVGARWLEFVATGLSSDNFELQFSSLFFLEIVDPCAAYEIGESNATRKLREIAEMTLMSEVGKMEAGRLLKMKKLQYQLEENVQVSMDAVAKNFGVRCKWCLIHVDVPARIKGKDEITGEEQDQGGLMEQSNSLTGEEQDQGQGGLMEQSNSLTGEEQDQGGLMMEQGNSLKRMPVVTCISI